jgi:hypothetical protein
MKIGGVDPKTLPIEEILVLPRGEHQIVFRAQGILDWTEFNAMQPEPTMPVKMTAKGIEPDITPTYKSDRAEYETRRLNYLIVTSLAPSCIEWETVDPSIPSTWCNWEQDLKNNKFNQVEINKIGNLALQANTLDEKHLKQARELFLRGLQKA